MAEVDFFEALLGATRPGRAISAYRQNQRQRDALSDLAQQVQVDPATANPQQARTAALANLAAATNNPEYAAAAFGYGSDIPSAIREYQFFQNLPEDQREMYLGVKRANQIVNTGNEQRVVSPTGQTIQQYQVTPRIVDTPEYQAAQTAAQENAKLTQQLNLNPQIASATEREKLTVQSQLEPSLNAANTMATETAKKDVEKTAELRKEAEANATNLQAFEDLKTASTYAPGGFGENALAGLANAANLETEGSKAQGAFTVARANAENAIRSTFRVAGSGAQSDADAKPFIDMLPNANDSEAVKISKVDAAVKAMRAKATALAKERGLPDPFQPTRVTVPTGQGAFVQTKTINGVTYGKAENGKWYKQ